VHTDSRGLSVVTIKKKRCNTKSEKKSRFARATVAITNNRMVEAKLETYYYNITKHLP